VKDNRVVLASIAVIFAVAMLLPLFVNVTGEKRVTPEFIRIEKIDIKAKEVNDSHATLEFVVTVYRSKIVNNASLITSVYDKKTNLLVQKLKAEIPKEGSEGLDEMSVTAVLEKDKEYNILFEIEKDKKIVSSRGMFLRGLDTLMPKDKELKMTLKDVDFQISDVKDDRVTVKARFYIETMENYNDTVFHIKAIQYESNVLADEKWFKMVVEKGKTVLVEGNLTVPKDYNYLIKLEVWRNGALLKSWSKGLNLAPTKRVPENVTEEKVRFEVSEFLKKMPTPMPMPTSTPEFYGVEKVPAPKSATPGFEVVVCAVALGGALLWRSRRR
jgi:hypothetical protein